MIVAAQKEHRPNSTAARAGHLADLHLIQGGGDCGHAVLCQHKAQHTAELLAGEGGIPQNFGKLIQNGAEDLPELTILLRCLHPAGGHKIPGLPLQKLRHACFQCKPVQGGGLICGGRWHLHILVQGQKRKSYLLPDGVNLFQPLLMLRSEFSPVAVRIGCPGDITEPHFTPDGPKNHIIFQNIAF